MNVRAEEGVPPISTIPFSPFISIVEPVLDRPSPPPLRCQNEWLSFVSRSPLIGSPPIPVPKSAGIGSSNPFSDFLGESWIGHQWTVATGVLKKSSDQVTPLVFKFEKRAKFRSYMMLYCPPSGQIEAYTVKGNQNFVMEKNHTEESGNPTQQCHLQVCCILTTKRTWF
ncbi:uncharacterized protein LOC144211999 [Stigmatopora nigra]